MSAGHHVHTYKPSAQFTAELHRLLKLPAVIEYLNRPYRSDFSQKVLYTGGSSIDGRTYYIDPDVPKALRKYVMWHERTEKAFRAVKGMHYMRAHRFATAAEHELVTGDGRDWDAYKREIEKYVRVNEAESLQHVPRSFDLGPYRESHDGKELAKLRTAEG